MSSGLPSAVVAKPTAQSIDAVARWLAEKQQREVVNRLSRKGIKIPLVSSRTLDGVRQIVLIRSGQQYV